MSIATATPLALAMAMAIQMETAFQTVASLASPSSFDAAKHSEPELALAFLSDLLMAKVFSFAGATESATRLFSSLPRRLMMASSESALVISF